MGKHWLSAVWITSLRPANLLRSSEAGTLPNQAPEKEQEWLTPECTRQEKGIVAGRTHFSHLQSHCLLTRMGWLCGRPCWLLTWVGVLQPDPSRSTPVAFQVQFMTHCNKGEHTAWGNHGCLSERNVTSTVGVGWFGRGPEEAGLPSNWYHKKGAILEFDI